MAGLGLRDAPSLTGGRATRAELSSRSTGLTSLGDAPGLGRSGLVGAAAAAPTGDDSGDFDSDFGAVLGGRTRFGSHGASGDAEDEGDSLW